MFSFNLYCGLRRFVFMVVNTIVDTKGLICPEPVMMLHNAIRDAAKGDVIEVHATDPSANRDIPKFCTFLGHELVEQREAGDVFIFFVRKG